MEEQLREQTLRAAADVSTKTAGDGELGEMVEKLQKENSAVKVELGRFVRQCCSLLNNRRSVTLNLDIVCIFEFILTD